MALIERGFAHGRDAAHTGSFFVLTSRSGVGHARDSVVGS
jgi:hypothetical protein